MRKKIEGNLLPNRNIFIYSGQDLTLLNILRALEVADQFNGIPDFGSTLIFELHALNSSNDYEIQIWYYSKSTDITPMKIKIPNCREPCFFDRFVASVNDLLVNDYTELCKLDK